MQEKEMRQPQNMRNQNELARQKRNEEEEEDMYLQQQMADTMEIIWEKMMMIIPIYIPHNTHMLDLTNKNELTSS